MQMCTMTITVTSKERGRERQRNRNYTQVFTSTSTMSIPTTKLIYLFWVYHMQALYQFIFKHKVYAMHFIIIDFKSECDTPPV